MKQVITYNGYTFPYTTMNVSSSVVYDEAHSVTGTIYTFRITGTIIAPTGKDTLDTEIYNMRNALKKPRQAFKVEWKDDSDVVQYTPYYFSADATANAGSTEDIDFGPKTQDLQLAKFTGNRAAIYDWTIVVFAKECWATTCAATTPDGSCLSPRRTEILSLTRSFSHRIDVNGLTTRTVSGRMLLTSLAMKTATADEWRNKVTPPLPLNYRRVSQDFSQSPDGRELTFSFVDEEQVYTLPQPATDGQASWNMTVDMGGLIKYALSGFYSAPPSVPKSTLIALVGQLAQAKFPLGTYNFVFEERSLTESVYGNRIDFNITATSAAMQATSNQPDYSVGLITFTIAPPNDGNQAMRIGPYGGTSSQTSGTIAPSVTKSLWDACASDPMYLTWNQNINPGNDMGYSAGQGRPEEQDNPYQSSGISTSHSEMPFVVHNELLSYEIDNGIVSFSPKVKETKPILQQTHAPKITLIQAGYSVRYAQSAADANKNNDFPPFPYTGESGSGTNKPKYNVAHASVSPEVPEPVGDGGWNKYTIRWRYVLVRSTDAQDMTDVGLVYPDDPRRPKTDREKFSTNASDYDPLIAKAGVALT